tara:strand:+ start:734 stop:1333 length:600 start_codon:yes stop_codon:yes gene_type:complete
MSNIKLVHSGGNSVSLTTPDSNPASNRTVKFPDASGVLALTNGITEFDHWYLSSSYTDTNNANITSWSRFTQSNVSAASPLGTGMSHSSGTFSFPSTGKYLVILNAVLLLVQNDNVLIDTRVTIDNSTYYSHTTARDGNSASNTIAGSGVSFAFIDVTNTSNVKVQFYAKSINSGSQILGYDASHGMGTSALFIRLGDT